MAKFREMFGTLGDAASIAGLFGVSMIAVVSGLAGFWAHLEKLRASYIVVVSAIVFVSILWSWIGLVWLFDRVKKPNASNSKPTLNCEWGLTVDGAFLAFDSGAEISCQTILMLRNLLSWPIRIEVISHSADVDGVVPNKKTSPSLPMVLMPNSPAQISFDGYSAGTIPSKTNYKGKMEIKIKYGHPDIGMTREMSRAYMFDLQLQLNPLIALIPQLPIDAPTPPVVGRFPLSLSATKSEEDKPL